MVSFLEKLKKGMGIEVSEPASKKEEKLIEPEIKKPEITEIQKEEKEVEGFTLEGLVGQEGQLVVDLYQTDGELVIQSTIAGVKAEELDVSIENDLILIRGNRKKPVEKEEINYFYQECYWGPFSRQIILPEEVDPSRAEATLQEGILTIRIPKIERKKKRKIEVKC